MDGNDATCTASTAFTVEATVSAVTRTPSAASAAGGPSVTPEG